MDATLRRLFLLAAVLVALPTEIAAFVRPASMPTGLGETALLVDDAVPVQAFLAGAPAALSPAAKGNSGPLGRLSAPTLRASGPVPSRHAPSAAAEWAVHRACALARLDFAGRDALHRAGLIGRGALAPPYRVVV